MNASKSLESRKQIWIALSDLYLDTELQDYNFKAIAKLIGEGPYSLEEVKEINKKEVFPILHWNLMSVAGVWTGFNEAWLISSIIKKKKRSNFFKRSCYNLMYFWMKGMFKKDWQKLENYHAALPPDIK